MFSFYTLWRHYPEEAKDFTLLLEGSMTQYRFRRSALVEKKHCGSYAISYSLTRSIPSWGWDQEGRDATVDPWSVLRRCSRW